MCFTVAILRKGVLMTTQQYYDNLPAYNAKNYNIPDFPDMYLVNGFSHPKLPVITSNGFDMFEWGLIPSWSKDLNSALDIRTKTLNAKGETIFEKPSFKQNIISHRCLLPVSAFYEWKEFKGQKYPYFIYPEDNSSFFLGSVYDEWLDHSSGNLRKSFSIVTTTANSLMETIHNTKKRMPLILNVEDSLDWLNNNLKRNDIQQLIKPYPENKMTAHTISKAANHVGNNRNVREIMNEVIYPELNQMNLFDF